MNIKELKEIIAGLPNDMPVLEGDSPENALDCGAEVVHDKEVPDGSNDFLHIVSFQ